MRWRMTRECELLVHGCKPCKRNTLHIAGILSLSLLDLSLGIGQVLECRVLYRMYVLHSLCFVLCILYELLLTINMTQRHNLIAKSPWGETGPTPRSCARFLVDGRW
jgi:hypothetical protein